ncbi:MULTISPECIES: hypothetical protein [unclassified Tolypothrix]|nr:MULTISPECIES: hypothetical protein [unclassified Tolypothrix]EKF04167.1 hypothetical protein FDUTEX481_02135 [Tolypothrix sp. PCC 7601]
MATGDWGQMLNTEYQTCLFVLSNLELAIALNTEQAELSTEKCRL